MEQEVSKWKKYESLAFQKGAEGKSWRKIKNELKELGVPDDVATNIAKYGTHPRPVQLRTKTTKKAFKIEMTWEAVKRVFLGSGKEGGKQIIIGFIVLLIGLLITLGTYSFASESGGTYVVMWGAILIGGINLIIGLFRWFGS